MEFGSKYTYFRSHNDHNEEQRNLLMQKKKKMMFGDQDDDQEIPDTNVCVIKFDTLKDIQQNVALGDPIFCLDCKSVLNKYSILLKQKEYETLLIKN